MTIMNRNLVPINFSTHIITSFWIKQYTFSCEYNMIVFISTVTKENKEEKRCSRSNDVLEAVSHCKVSRVGEAVGLEEIKTPTLFAYILTRTLQAPNRLWNLASQDSWERNGVFVSLAASLILQSECDKSKMDLVVKPTKMQNEMDIWVQPRNFTWELRSADSVSFKCREAMSGTILEQKSDTGSLSTSANQEVMSDRP